MGKVLKEVYVAYGKNREVLYVGQGNIGRHKHCSSGCSHNKELNRYYFLNGEERSMTVEVVKFFKSEKDSLKYEDELIILHNPRFNIKSSRTNQVEYMQEAKDFYKDFEIKLTNAGIKLHSPHHVRWMNNMKIIVKHIGYKNLKDGVLLSRASVRNFGDEDLCKIFIRLIKGQVNTVFSTSFHVNKECDSDMYFVKLLL